MEPGSSGRSAGETAAAPGLGGGGTPAAGCPRWLSAPPPASPWHPPAFPRVAVDAPQRRFLAPRGGQVSAAAFGSRQLLPQWRGDLHPTGPSVPSQRGAALCSCPHTQKPGVPAPGCSEAHGGHAHLMGAPGQAESEVCVGARVDWGLFAAPVCALASFCTETSSVDEMRSWRASLGGTD